MTQKVFFLSLKIAKHIHEKDTNEKVFCLPISLLFLFFFLSFFLYSLHWGHIEHSSCEDHLGKLQGGFLRTDALLTHKEYSLTILETVSNGDIWNRALMVFYLGF